ncbi:MAG: amino acid ABC transporter substrate-binding protein, partial [Deltaproteobacteria bacterium]|nr:amino acid ABC transporter substrate-binding protein [Deltaproteobacteria bacterium]
MKRNTVSPKAVYLGSVIALVLGLFVFFIYRDYHLERPEEIYITSSGRVDMCLFCHTKEKIDPAHDASIIGCASCHLGDPLAIEEDKAHQGIVRNPGDLRIVEKTCGIEGCHPTDVKKVVNSLMATNRGILGTLLYYWGESETQDTETTVKDLIDSGETSLALDYYRKLCGTCHLWKQKNNLEGLPTFFNEKGGGCSACHFVMPQGYERAGVTESDDEIIDDAKVKIHPLVSQKVPDNNCIRCHNRSGRIGLAYIGVFESEGYGTPYEKGQLSSRKMPGDRFYLELADDIHHQRGMACIDCHTRNEVMGDGTSYAHYEEQLEISCEVCHRLEPGTTRKGNELINVSHNQGVYKLQSKLTEKQYELREPKKGVCDFPAHKKVTCEACHSPWVPQCYGCHAKRDASQTHLDKVSLEETLG